MAVSRQTNSRPQRSEWANGTEYHIQTFTTDCLRQIFKKSLEMPTTWVKGGRYLYPVKTKEWSRGLQLKYSWPAWTKWVAWVPGQSISLYRWIKQCAGLQIWNRGNTAGQLEQEGRTPRVTSFKITTYNDLTELFREYSWTAWLLRFEILLALLKPPRKCYVGDLFVAQFTEGNASILRHHPLLPSGRDGIKKQVTVGENVPSRNCFLPGYISLSWTCSDLLACCSKGGVVSEGREPNGKTESLFFKLPPAWCLLDFAPGIPCPHSQQITTPWASVMKNKGTAASERCQQTPALTPDSLREVRRLLTE